MTYEHNRLRPVGDIGSNLRSEVKQHKVMVLFEWDTTWKHLMFLLLA